MQVHRLFFESFNDIKNFKESNINKDQLVESLSTHYMNSEYYIEEEYQEICDNLELNKLKGRNLGENGCFISGGEKQRIAIARFLLKKDYDFFIIDEPLTSLDSKNEKILLDILKENTNNKTGLIISHKFNILNTLANYFYVINDSVVKEKGTHEQLSSSKGLYRELYESYKNNIL